jgi:hypothetical protein
MSLTPIYEYYADDLWRYQYSTNDNIGNNWKKTGIAFYVQNESISNITTPIYGHYADDPWRFNYSRSSEVSNGWKAGSIEFYAETQSGTGKKPVYLYYSENPWRTMLSMNPDFGYGWSRGEILFYAIPANFVQFSNLECTSAVIQYQKDFVPPAPVKLLLDEHTFTNNDSTASASHNISPSKTFTTTFEWTLSEQLSFGIDTSIEAGIPDEGDVKTTYKMNLQFGSQQKQSYTEQTTFQFSETITVPPKSSVKVTSTVDWLKNLEVPFVIYATYAAKKGFDLTGQQISDIYAIYNPNIQRESIDASSVVVVLHGRFKGSYGLRPGSVVNHYDG